MRFAFLIKSRTIFYNLFFQKLRSKNGIKKYMTHQEIYKILNEDDKLKFENLFSYYEKTKFGKKNNFF